MAANTPPETVTARNSSWAENSLIGLLAIGIVLGVPRYIESIESTKAADAYDFLSHVYDLQHRHHASHGHYAASLAMLDLARPLPTHFSIGEVETDDRGWTLSLKRVGSNLGYGDYRITFDENGFDRYRSDVDRQINPHSCGNLFPLGQR